ncbi:MAG: translation initiation factor IF-2 [Flavobacteriales bacterium]|nr:translation initiation factor IF-2 [Flavobacteriales bacterium]
MSEEKVKRLSKVAREFNIGITTLIDFLASKGVKIDSNPNSKIEPNAYQLLLSEFQSEKNVKEESKLVSIGTQKETISLPGHDVKKEETKAVEEIPTIVPKQEDEIKVVGKIDLSSLNQRTRPDKKAKEEKTVEPTQSVVPEPTIEEKTPVKQEIETVYEKLAEPKVLGKIELPVEKKIEKKPVEIKTENKDNKENKEKRKRITRKVDLDVTKKDFQKQNKGGKNQGGRVERKPELTEQEIQDQIKETLAKLTGGGKSKASKHRREKRQAVSEQIEQEGIQQEIDKKTLKVTEFVTVSEIAKMMNVSVNDIIGACMSLGMFVSINQRLDAETLTIIAEEYGFKLEFVSATEESEALLEIKDDDKNLEERPPIVTVMGHVDHGKTSLLDYVRKANVIAGEAGGITQHIGAYSVELKNGKRVTFLDTPGHEAFTAMRARGAQVTDVVIIVVAADDSVMPQTKEAINHAQAAGVPIIIAINKIDKPGANPDKVREELSQMNILVEEWGGKFQSQEISAKFGQGVDELLEKVILEAEILDLKANPNRNGVGTVIESELDKGRGYVSTVLVQTGTMKVGDALLAGCYSGKIKAMFNERGQNVRVAGPSTPVSILGLNGAPNAGDKFHVMDDEKEARSIAERRLQLQREQGVRTHKHITLDEIGRRLAIGDFKELNIIIKGDVDGSIEALSDSFQKLSTDQIQVNVIHKSVGQISESDVMLAAASEAVIIGFQVRPSMNARKLAESEQIDIRLYSIIYDAINELKDAMEGMLAPKFEEKIVATVEIREVFKISKVGTIAGCMVLDGKIDRKNKIRVIREGIVVHTGELGSLKRFKDDVKEVAKGYECGLNINNFNDIQVNDIVEAFEMVEVKQKLG